MTQALSKEADLYFLTEILIPNWDPSQTVGFDPGAAEGTEAHLPWADTFNSLGQEYPQFTVQTSGEESSGGTTSYDYLTNSGPGQNRNGTLTAQVRVEETDDGSGYTGDSATYGAVGADRLATLIRQEIERITLENPTAGNTEFSFVGSNANEVPDETGNTLTVYRSGATISYGFLRDSL
jgi:hypothetical protein